MFSKGMVKRKFCKKASIFYERLLETLFPQQTFPISIYSFLLMYHALYRFQVQYLLLNFLELLSAQFEHVKYCHHRAGFLDLTSFSCLFSSFSSWYLVMLESEKIVCLQNYVHAPGQNNITDLCYTVYRTLFYQCFYLCQLIYMSIKQAVWQDPFSR